MQHPSPSWSCRAAAGDAAEEQPMRHRQPEGDGSARFRSMGRVDVLAACSTGRISCRQMALTLHWGVARDAVAERCASGRAAALQHLVARKDFIQADCILFTIQVKHRERTCARCVNVIHHDLSLFGGRGPRWSTSFSCHYGKASGMWTSIGDWG